MHYRRMHVPGASYFFTVVTHGRRPIFADAQAVRLLEAAIGRVREKRPFTIEAQVVLPDHLFAPRDWPHATFSDWVARGLYDADRGSQGPLELPAWAGHE